MLRQAHLPPLPGLLLRNPEIRTELLRPERQHIPEPEPGMNRNPHDDPILNGQELQHLLQLFL